MSRYVQRSIADFRAVLDPKYFTETIENTEYVFSCRIRTSKSDTNHTLIIYSSVDTGTGVTKNCADDAIRFVIRNDITGKHIKFKTRIYRTKNAMQTLLVRSREAFAYVFGNRCECGSLYIERKAKKSKKTFMGCTAFPNCKNTRHKCKFCDNSAVESMTDPNDDQPFPVDGNDVLSFEAPEVWHLCRVHYDECIEI